MEEWKEYKLGDVADITKLAGFEFTKYMKYISDGEIIAIRALNLRNGHLDLHDVQRISREVSDGLLRSKLHEGETILSYTGTIGACAIITENDKYHLAPNVCKMTPSKIVYPFFLYYIIRSEYFQNALLGYAHGSTQPTIPMKTIREIPIKICSFEKQIAIANILKSLDDKIELNRKINANLEAQAQALFKSWFVDFEPFKDQPFVESELGMIPEGWKVGNIYEYIDVIYGAPYKSSLFNENKDGLPLIRIRDLKTNAPQFYTPELLPNTEYINAGDIVAGMDAEFIPYVWLGEKGVLNQRCCKFKGKNDAISNYYILFLIKPELEYVQSYKTGTTVSHLGKSDIDRFRFITPPLDVVLAFSERVNPMKEEVVNRAKESRRLASLRDALLPRLMSGELKVK